MVPSLNLGAIILYKEASVLYCQLLRRGGFQASGWDLDPSIVDRSGEVTPRIQGFTNIKFLGGCCKLWAVECLARRCRKEQADIHTRGKV